MFELGDEGAKSHSELGRIIKRNKIDLVVTTGELMKNLDSELKKIKIESVHFDNRKGLAEYLKALSFSDSVVLVKGQEECIWKSFQKL